jgi:hypothetical protein
MAITMRYSDQSFPDDFFGIFIVAEAGVLGVAEVIGTGPFGEIIYGRGFRAFARRIL